MGIDPLRRFDEVADEVARTIDDGKATDLLLLSPPTSPDLSAARRARQPARGQEAGDRGAAVSPATVASKNMESMINTWRGWVCLIVTALSILIVLQQPRLVFFWKPVGARLAWEETGLPGTLLAGFFVVYLCADTLIAFLMRSHLQRSLGPLYIHHTIVVVGVLCYMFPSPPRALFMYMWGEALTACRILPAGPYRWRARSLVFALRRALWLFLLTRDLALFSTMRHRKGLVGALVPPAVSLSLLALDQMWWTEHAAQVQRCAAVATSEAGDPEGDISEKLLAPSSQLLGAAGELLQHGGDLLVAAGAGARDGASELVERYASELRAATEGGGGGAGGGGAGREGRLDAAALPTARLAAGLGWRWTAPVAPAASPSPPQPTSTPASPERVASPTARSAAASPRKGGSSMGSSGPGGALRAGTKGGLEAVDAV